MRRVWGVLLALLVAAGATAQPNAPQNAQPAAPAPTKKAKAPVVKKNVRPAWAELTAEQQAILSPLKNDWDTLEVERRQKWIQIAKRYPKMKPQEQERVQRRMHDLAALTPEQRRQARENYRQMAKVPADKRKLREQWAEYQQLSPLERESMVFEPVEPPKKKKK